MVLLGKESNSDLSHLNITTVLFNPHKNTTLTVPLNIYTEIQKYSADKNIKKIFKQNGILLDGESLGLFYELNPDYNNETPNIYKIVVPKFSGNKDYLKALEDGYLVAITLDRNIKIEFIKMSETLGLLKDQVSKNYNALFEFNDVKSTFFENLNSICEIMRLFRVLLVERTRPLSSEVIHQMTNEGEYLTHQLTEVLEKKHELSTSTVEFVKQIMINMEIRSSFLKEKKGPGKMPDRWPESRVIVRIFNLKNGKRTEVQDLRVHYVPKALWKVREKYKDFFCQIGSPVSKTIPCANYCIWASKPENAAEPLTEKMELSLRKEEQVELDLVMIK